MIARVFPRKTAMSPTDALAFFGQPTIENIADCIKAGVTEIHMLRHLLRSADCRQWTQYRLHAAGTVMAAG